MIRFYGYELLAPLPAPKMEDHLLSAVCDCLFNIFTATLNIGGRSSIRNLRTRHAVVTGTHLSWIYIYIQNGRCDIYTYTHDTAQIRTAVTSWPLFRTSQIQSLVLCWTFWNVSLFSSIFRGRNSDNTWTKPRSLPLKTFPVLFFVSHP